MRCGNKHGDSPLRQPRPTVPDVGVHRVQAVGAGRTTLSLTPEVIPLSCGNVSLSVHGPTFVLVKIHSVARLRAGGRTAVAPPDRTVLLLLALYACWGSAIPAMKLLIFLLAGVVFAGAARGRPRPTRGQLRRLAVAGVLLLVGGQGLATVALTAVTASLGAILAVAIPLRVVLLSGFTGTPVSAASWVRLVAGFGGIVIVVVTAPGSAFGGAPWGVAAFCVAAFCVAPILWAAGSLVTANVGRPVDRVAASAVQLLARGTVLLLAAVPLGQLDPARWQDISWTSAAAAVFLLGFDSLAGFMLYTSLLESAPAPLVSAYAYITPLVGAVIGADRA